MADLHMIDGDVALFDPRGSQRNDVGNEAPVSQRQ